MLSLSHAVNNKITQTDKNKRIMQVSHYAKNYILYEKLIKVWESTQTLEKIAKFFSLTL